MNDGPADLPPLIGQAASFHGMLDAVTRAAPLDRPVLVIGERGTGKELVAARLHFLSRRWDKPLIKLNCAALAEGVLESELFGHEAGAFTGAVRRHVGRFELAQGGTLILDEIANCSAAVQEKLLRAVEYGSFERVGGTQTIACDVRVIGATNADLPALAEQGRFRADLLDRLAFDVITLPPLRARRDDIPVLARHFALGMVRLLGREYFPGFTPQALALLEGHCWPGNVRELRNAVERSVYRSLDPEAPVCEIILDPFASPYRAVVAPAQMLPAQMLPAQMLPVPPLASAFEEPGAASLEVNTPDAHSPDAHSFVAQVNAFERKLLAAALGRCCFNQKQAAAELGLGYHQFRRHIQRHGLTAGNGG
ncbi:MAG: phage shock protein operon transcriptional activator [Rhodospirillaceae bacterium]